MDELDFENIDTAGSGGIDDFDFEGTEIVEEDIVEVAEVNGATAEVIVAEVEAPVAEVEAPVAEVAEVAEVATKAAPVKKTRVRKPKMSSEDLVKMANVVVEVVEPEADQMAVKRSVLMAATDGKFSLKDVYREILHPRFKSGTRGCYNGVAILNALSEQVTSMATDAAAESC
jgi:hypothetical protein